MLLQETLQDKEEKMKLVNEHYEHKLHEVKSEKERLQQQIRDYGQMLQQNHEQIEILRQEGQAALRDRKKPINQLTQQYEQQLHLLRQVKTESGSEKERLQQHILKYEQMLQQNNEQIEILIQENEQGPALVGPMGEKYPMNKTPHGIAVIINNFKFHTSPYRRGSQVDEDNLRVTWEYLQYDVLILRNLTASELTRQLMEIALKSHEKYDSFVCCILSHGSSDDGVYGVDSKTVKIIDIACLFKAHFCPTLAGKPKLFFIQSERGNDEDKGTVVQKDDEDKGMVVQKEDEDKGMVVQKEDEDKGMVVQKEDEDKGMVIQKEDEDKGMVVQKEDEDKGMVVQKEDEDEYKAMVVQKDDGIVVQKDDEDKDDEHKIVQDDEDKRAAVQKDAKGDPDDALHHSLPIEADFLFGYSTPLGYLSWRSPRYGSWYISKLCEVLVDYAPQQDLLTMLTIVNRKVSDCYTAEGFKQCPAPVSLLRKQVWFFKNVHV